MKCIKCGNELPENAQFCANCGAPQQHNTSIENPNPISSQPTPTPADSVGFGVPDEPQQANPINTEYAYTAPAPNSTAPAMPQMHSALNKSKGKLVKLIVNALGALSGIVSVIMGIAVKGKACGIYSMSNTYGGDAYTGMQNAAADTANNILAANRILTTGLSAICVGIGLAVTFYFVSKIIDIVLKNKTGNNE